MNEERDRNDRRAQKRWLMIERLNIPQWRMIHWLNKRLSFPLGPYLHVLLGTLSSQPAATLLARRNREISAKCLEEADPWAEHCCQAQKQKICDFLCRRPATRGPEAQDPRDLDPRLA